ncbi:MAG: pyridoxal phosphate-dependent aminotransferase [Chitinispirillaceae bacterium]
MLPELHITTDACFLSNPYATDLFLDHFRQELFQSDRIRRVLEFYPSQNSMIADYLSTVLNLGRDYIFIANGAIEAIQAVMHNFAGQKTLINIPSFSSYYEFCKSSTRVLYYQLEKKNDFVLVPREYTRYVKEKKPDSIVLINPNNPDGGYIRYEDLHHIISSLREVQSIIIDESFIHFAFEDEQCNVKSAVDLVREFPNLIVIKSMSKDFGVAGIRAGYAVMNKNRVSSLLKNGYLWNSNGISEFFFKLYSKPEFHRKYDLVRKKYISEVQSFFRGLSDIREIKTYPSKANFALIELLDGSRSSDFVAKMLTAHGIYTRTCSDKKGLAGEFVRIAARTKAENEMILDAVKDVITGSDHAHPS